MPDPSHNNEAAAEYVSYYASKQMLKNTVNRLYHHGMAKQRAAIAKAEQELYPPQPPTKRSQAQIEAYLHDRVEKELLRRQQHRASLRRAFYGDEILVEHNVNSYHNQDKRLITDKHHINGDKKAISSEESAQQEQEEENNLFRYKNNQHIRDNRHTNNIKDNFDRNKATLNNNRIIKNGANGNNNSNNQKEMPQLELETAQRSHRHRYLTPHELREHLKHVYTDLVKRRARREKEIEKFLALYGTCSTATSTNVSPRRRQLLAHQAHQRKHQQDKSISSSMPDTPVKNETYSNRNENTKEATTTKRMSREEAKMYEEERLRELELGWRTPSLKVSHDAEDVETLWVTPSMEILQQDKSSNNTEHVLSKFTSTHPLPLSARRGLSPSSSRSLTSPRQQRYGVNKLYNRRSSNSNNKNVYHATRSVSLERLSELARPLRVTPRVHGSGDAAEGDQNFQLTDSNHKPVPKFHVYRKVEYNDQDAYLEA